MLNTSCISKMWKMYNLIKNSNLMGYGTMQSTNSRLIFRRNMLLAPSETTNMLSKKSA